ncbi:MAG: hypothetical protein WBD41_02085 [Rhodococcus sp. (in: high G+C Gram-positive bacteria)]
MIPRRGNTMMRTGQKSPTTAAITAAAIRAAAIRAAALTVGGAIT